MRWRVTLTHSSGSKVLSEPEGMTSAIIGLFRHPELHSLVKEFKTPMRLYGSNGTQDGGRDWLKGIEQEFGPDAVIDELIEYAPDGFIFERLYSGEVGIQTIIEELNFDHGLEFTGVQDGYWRKAMSRWDVPVNIQASENLDGVAVAVIPPTTLRLPTQIINYYGEYRFNLSYTYSDATGEWDGFQIDWDNIVRDDIQKLSVGNGLWALQSSGSILIITAAAQFIAPWDGEYQFDVQFIYARLNGGVWAAAGGGDFGIIKIGEPASNKRNFTDSTYYSGGGDTIRKAVFQDSFTLRKGDQVSIFYYTDPDKFTIFGELRLSYKTDCDLATTGNVTLSGEQVVDGVPTSSSRVLVWQQGDGTENGIYVTGAGAWTRATDLDIAAEFINAAVVITDGDLYEDAAFRQVNDEFSTVGTSISEWEEFTASLEHDRPYPAGAPDVENFCYVTALTTYKETTIESFLLHDVIASVLDRITDYGKFYSELLGSPDTLARVYDEAGCYWNNMVSRGLHVRGYTMTEKQFSMSMKDIWEGINAHLNLYVGYENIQGIGNVIRLEEKSHGYDDSSMSVLLSGVQKIKRKYSDQYFNSVETGISKGLIEDISGIDDPQKQTRASVFKNIGRKLTLLSTWITQSLTWEHARRTEITKSSDYKYDNDAFMVEVTKEGSQYTPRLDEDYDSVTGLLNEETRINKRWTPARMFLRWSNYIFNGVQNYVGTVYRFVSGEGNYDMTSERVPDDCSDNYNGQSLAENEDILVTSDYLYVPIEYEIEHYLTKAEFDTIDDNRKKAIGISQTYDDGSHKEFFITDLQYEIMSGQIKLTGFFKEYFDIITVPPGGQIFQGGKIFDATFDFSFE